MSDDKALAVAREVGQAVVEGTCAPVAGALRILSRAFGRPDLNEIAVSTLQEDVVRLFRMLEERVSELSSELKGKIDPIEAAEMVTQAVVNMGRTASREKRRRMTNVLLNGLCNETTDEERRHFMRAVTELDVDHIEYLRCVQEQRDFDAGSSTLVAVHGQLWPYGFTKSQRADAVPADGPRKPVLMGDLITLTPLGARFVSFLQDPEEVE